MYFPLGVARRLRPSVASTCDDAPPLPSSLADLAKLGGAREEVAIQVARDAEGELFAVLGEAELSVWSVRPAVLLAKVVRTPLSLRTMGANLRMTWYEAVTGEAALIVQTARDKLLYYVLDYAPKDLVYQMPMGNPKTSAFRFGTGEANQVTVILKHAAEHDIAAQGCSAFCATEQGLLIATTQPVGLRWLAWEVFQASPRLAEPKPAEPDAFTAGVDLEWLSDMTVQITSIEYSADLDLFVLITADGCAYTASYVSKAPVLNRSTSKVNEIQNARSKWRGECLHGKNSTRPLSVSAPAPASTPPVLGDALNRSTLYFPPTPRALGPGKHAVMSAINARFSLLVIGLQDGSMAAFSLGLGVHGHISHVNALRSTLNSTASHLETGSITSLSWSSDGYALAAGWQRGWSLWSVFGRLLCWGIGNEEETISNTFEDAFMRGISGLFWTPGDLELFLLSPPRPEPKGKIVDEQLYTLPLARSAVTGMHSPDNTNQGFLQLDDRVLVYRGADQPDMSVINPESDVWQNIKIPPEYLYANWPLRCAVISADTRWKVFQDELQEQSFHIQGGMQWHRGFLFAAVMEDNKPSIRVFTRDRPLNLSAIVCEEKLNAQVILMAIFDNSLLVYTVDNTLHHFLIDADETIGLARLRLCSDINFEGVVREAKRVRGMSWLVPRSQQRFGDPADDLNVATIIFLIDGRLVLLRPRKAGADEVKYDLQMLANRVEFYWTHLSGIGALENSLWAWDGRSIKIWLNALNIDASIEENRKPQAVKESVSIVPDFYPLSVLIDKGVIVGVDYDTSLRRSLDFAIFRMITQTHLFLQHILRFHIVRNQIPDAVLFASCYQHLVYFAHGLEILLHSVLEDEADALLATRPSTPVQMDFQRSPTPDLIAGEDAVLPRVVAFLDHFDEALQVVVGCARKTEIKRWGYLFNAVGKPRGLFERCMEAGQLKVAASYLLVLHNLESIEQSSSDTVRLLRAAMTARDWMLCKELLRFLYSLDRTGRLLQQALDDADALPSGFHRRKSDPSGIPKIYTSGGPEPQFNRRPSAPNTSVRPTSPSLGFGSLLAKVGFGGSGSTANTQWSALEAMRTRSSPVLR